MKMRIIPLTLLLGSTAIHAGNQGLYVGGGIGLGSLKPPSSLYVDREAGFGGRAFLGYNFNQYFGLETDYAAIGSRKYTSSFFPNTTTKYSLDAISLVGKVYLPLADDSPLSIYGLVGGAQMRDKYSNNGWFSRAINNTAYVPTAGLGLNYDFSQRFSAGVELSGYGKKNDANSYNLPYSALGTLSLGYRF
ncbi:MAG: porin family protein [Legionella sp.]|nr:MAG: porin family protein [Legionella sp.]